MEIGFGGGCHWCTEAIFSSLKGIDSVKQGFIRSHAPNDRYSEAVLVNFADDEINLSRLIEIHLRTHASSSSHSMRSKYRSAVYVNDSLVAEQCLSILNTLQLRFENSLVTQILETVHFKSSPESYTDYYVTNPNRPFCITYIEPKLDMLRRDFTSCLKFGYLKQGQSQAADNAS